MLSASVILAPAYNEEAAIAAVIAEARRFVPGADVVVINDCSGDRTAAVARGAGAAVIDLPCKLGVGGAMQAGFLYAYTRGYRYAIRCDGDGQHPPEEIPRLAAAMAEGGADLVIGTRFLSQDSYKTTAFRGLGIRGLAAFLSLICRARVTDPTSGFQMINRPLLYCFAHSYPSDYPEPESLALLRRQGYTFREVPVRFRARQTGCSSIHSRDAVYYALKVALALLVDRARTVDTRYAKFNLGESA
jgi:glycosyltransferase involved in cell wall biosynthesis